jgi:hypothetical protein
MQQRKQQQMQRYCRHEKHRRRQAVRFVISSWQAAAVTDSKIVMWYEQLALFK